MAEAKKEKAHSTENKKEEAKTGFQSQGLYRSETNKVIAGVCGGLGEYFDIDATIIRIIFVLMAIFGGSGLIIYIVLWLVIPPRSQVANHPKDTIRENIEDMKSASRSFAHSIRNPGMSQDNSRFWWALLIIILGFFFLMNNYGLLEIDFEKLWPLILIIFGLAILLRKR